jgi:fructose-bisphosphate aldolase class II
MLIFFFSKGQTMALVNLKTLLDFAATHHFALPAFNVNNLEQIQAILSAADKTDSPVILQVSAGGRKYANPVFLKKLLEGALEQYPHLPICLHQDHGASPAVCLASIRLGFSSVMMDGSLLEDMKTPSSYEYNVAVTRKTVEIAHSVGVSVEGELGCLGSLESLTSSKEDGSGAEGLLSREQLLTCPEQALDFVEKTGVDALAVAIGTSHGAYKFQKKPTAKTLSIDRLAQIHAKIPSTHLVLHGSSSVPEKLVSQINHYGGKLGQTYGVPIEAIQKAIEFGVRKVNIDTDLRLAATAAIYQDLHENPSNFDPRHYLSRARESMSEICHERFVQLKAASMARQFREQKEKLYESCSL